jgi:carbamoyl-phosphate synthase / aspartate carbamoyltransferase / dihydroorotase
LPTIRLPGLVDPHVHLREPGGTHKEDFETGTHAALAGGFTTVLAMPNTQPPLIDSSSLALAEDAAARHAVCDYGMFLGASVDNIETAAHFAPRCAGLKFYLDATFGPLHLKDLGAVRAHFARWPKNRPIACHAEERTLAAVLMCAWLEQRSVHICHVSRREEIELIRDAKMRGVQVTCEVCPHHLFLSTEDIPFLGAGRSEVRPRLAAKTDQIALWSNFDVIDCIATDHAPHLPAEKDGPNPPPGFPGLETALPLMLTTVHRGRLPLEDVVQRMYHNPLRIFGLPEQPDTWIEVDPDATWTVRGADLHSRSRWTPFEGWTLHGRVERVTVRGREVYRSGTFNVQPGVGRNVAPGTQSAGEIHP